MLLGEDCSFDDYVEKHCYFAGEIQVEAGYITRLTGYSGHFLPGIQHMAHAIIVLNELGANLDYLNRIYMFEIREIKDYIEKTSDGVAYISAESVLGIIDNAYGANSVHRA